MFRYVRLWVCVCDIYVYIEREREEERCMHAFVSDDMSIVCVGLGVHMRYLAVLFAFFLLFIDISLDPEFRLFTSVDLHWWFL